MRPLEDDDWDKEWDKTSHTSDEYRKEIRDLRQRILFYLEEIRLLKDRIESLRSDVHELERITFRNQRES